MWMREGDDVVRIAGGYENKEEEYTVPLKNSTQWKRKHVWERPACPENGVKLTAGDEDESNSSSITKGLSDRMAKVRKGKCRGKTKEKTGYI